MSCAGFSSDQSMVCSQPQLLAVSYPQQRIEHDRSQGKPSDPAG